MTRTRLAFAATLGSAGLLIAALIFQYGLGMAPCALCIWQRWPHLAAVLAGGISLAAPSLPVFLCGAAAAATSGGIAFYHTGVERGWFEGPTACSGAGALTGQSIDDILNFERSFVVVRCDEVPWEMLGLSMASWNGVASFALAGIWLMAARQA